MTAPHSPGKPDTVTNSATEPRTRRLFFALWPDAALTHTLHGLARELAAHQGGRCMDEDSLHLTLAFLGDVPADLVESALRVANDIQQEAFTLQLDQLAHWPHNRIAWAGCSKPPIALMSLANTLQHRLRQAEFTIEPRPFAPHVTLLRNCRQATAAALTPLHWPAREFVLVESLSPADRDGGGRYRIIGRWPLFATPKKTRG